MVNKTVLRIVSFISVIMVLLTILILPTFADDDTKVFTVPMNQPSTDLGRGYIEYVVEGPNYQLTPVTLFWYIYPSDPNIDLWESRVHVSVSDVNKLILDPHLTDGSSNFTFYYSAVWGDGTTNYYYKVYNSSSSTPVEISLASGYKFYGFKGYGNIGSFTYMTNYYPKQNFVFQYAEDSPEYEALFQIHQDLVTIKGALTSNYGDLAGESVANLLSYIDETLLFIGQTSYDIYTQLNTTNYRLQFLVNQTDQLETLLTALGNNTDALESLLRTVISHVDNVEPLLQDILDALTTGDEQDPPPPVDSGDATDKMNQMDDFVGGSSSQQTQSNIQSSLSGTNLTGGLSTQASGFLWDILQRFLDGNSKVFAMIMSVLSYGLIALLFGR